VLCGVVYLSQHSCYLSASVLCVTSRKAVTLIGQLVYIKINVVICSVNCVVSLRYYYQVCQAGAVIESNSKSKWDKLMVEKLNRSQNTKRGIGEVYGIL
jgi:hypothetical protein